MRVPTQGTSAYKYEELPYERPYVVRKVSTKKKNKTASYGALLVVSVLLLAFCLLFRYAQILEKSAQIRDLKTQLDAVNGQVVTRQFEIERNLDLKKVETEAITRLGMQRPTKAQTVFLDRQNNDYAEVAQKEEPRNLISGIVKGVSEYFG